MKFIMKKRNLRISGGLILIAVIFTILIKVVDVKAVGVNNSNIGFSTVNKFISEKIGVNMLWYSITDWLGVVAILFALGYAIIGGIQVIKRKSIFKVDKEIIALGIFYILIVAVYILFEKLSLNYRPVLMDGVAEASYPSSHTLMSVCICGSAILINKKLFNNKISKILNVLSLILIIAIVVGRLISGVHWFTDIIGGLLISSALLMSFYTAINGEKTNK